MWKWENVTESHQNRSFKVQVSQGHFDLLAELMKFNEEAFKQFEEAIQEGDRFDQFMKLASERLVNIL